MANAFRAPWLLLVVCLVLVSSPIGASAQSPNDWVQLLTAGSGAPGSQPVTSIAVAPDWPTTRLILARRDDRLLRTQDGGTSWQDIGPAPGEGLLLSMFAGSRVAFTSSKTGIYRSTDDGATWQHVLPVTATVALSMPKLSPQFGVNGRAMVESDNRLFVSSDGGATWPQVEPVSGQRIAWSGFWPESGPDRDLYAVVSSESGLRGQLYRGGDGGWQLIEPVAGQVTVAPLFASGGRVLLILPNSGPDAAPAVVSSDDGATWSPVGANLAAGGQPQQIDAAAVSPRLADDGTIFLSTVGAERSRSALFRGDALGATWTHLVSAPLASSEHQRVNRQLTLSPQYGADRTALLSEHTSQGTPSSGACKVSRTADGGTTWASVYFERRATCTVSPLVGPEGVQWLLAVSNPGGLFRSRSTDGGQTWKSISPGMGNVTSVVASPGFERDGALFAGTRGGEIWAQGASLQPIASQPATSQATCPTEPVGGFGRVWSSEPGVRERLGCPTAPEAPIDIRMRRDSDALGIWLEDDSDVWVEVSTRDGTYQRRSKQTDVAFWQAIPYGVMSGAAQPFVNGTMIFLPGDGTRTILVLDSSGKAQELPD